MSGEIWGTGEKLSSYTEALNVDTIILMKVTLYRVMYNAVQKFITGGYVMELELGRIYPGLEITKKICLSVG